MQKIDSHIQLGSVIQNIPEMLRINLKRFRNHVVFKEQDDSGTYAAIQWETFVHNIQNIAYKLVQSGFQKSDKMVLFSRNCLAMLQVELAVMACGGVAVPIFSNFKKETAQLLIKHSEASWLFIHDATQLDRIDADLNLKHIITFDKIEDNRLHNLIHYPTLLDLHPNYVDCFDYDMESNAVCLNMYTSGTMGVPKCVQLSHRNILSQQAALALIWDIGSKDRLLSYLPWHHSFGGIFELFTGLYHGACISLESSYGKDPKSILRNWKQIKPTLFFSVPKVYQALIELTREQKEAEEIFFHSDLKFIFTAAASLPEQLSIEFEKRNIPIIEGWGLTETAPCCTLTNPLTTRATGVVGFPIPGVSIRTSDDEEIQVKGPNVMVGYFNNETANKDTFTEDGWYKTGDVGKITEQGLQLISRKDRIFKLSNGEKVIPTDLEKAIEFKCHYIQYAVVSGNGRDFPVALIFPNKKLLENPDYEMSPEEGCFCPRNLQELGKCLRGCLHIANQNIGQKFSKIKSAAVILDELSIDDSTLTPSMKMAPDNVLKKYKNHLQNLYGELVPVEEEVFVVSLDEKYFSHSQAKEICTK